MYGPAPYLAGEVPTPAGPVPRIATRLTCADRLGSWRVRWGIARDDYRVRPGLYAFGDPEASAPVLVTANYKLTLDALRSALPGVDAWLLVVDTRGVNVWCAAGKGTFSAGEVARMVEETRLAEVVGHTRLILPQLAAPGVAAHLVKEACGFRDHGDALRGRAVVLGVSKDSLSAHERFIAKYRLPFVLLSDPDQAVMKAYGAWGEKMMYGKPVTGVIRSTVVIGPDGRVLKHWARVKQAAVHPDEVLAFLSAPS